MHKSVQNTNEETAHYKKQTIPFHSWVSNGSIRNKHKDADEKQSPANIDDKLTPKKRKLHRKNRKIDDKDNGSARST